MLKSNFGNVLRKLVYFKRITNGGLGAQPQTVGRFFCKFFEKKASLMSLNHISHEFRAI